MDLSQVPLYCVRVLSKSGKKRTVKVLADDETEAIVAANLSKSETVQKLRKIVGLERFLEGIFLKKPKEDEIVGIFDKVARLLRVNFPAEKAFLMQISGIKRVESKYLLTQIVKRFALGDGLRSAFGRYPNIFSESLLAMLDSAEKSNEVEPVLEKIAKTYQNRKKFTQKLTTQLIYPGIVMIIGTLVLVGFTFFFIPQLKNIYANFGAELPPVTEGLYLITQQFKRMPLLVILPVGIMALICRKRRAIFKSQLFQTGLYRIPLLGPFLWKKDLKQVLEYLILLLNSGISFKEAIPSVSGVTENFMLKEILGAVSDKINQGESLSNAFEHVEDKWQADGETITHVVKIGEETGDLERFLGVLNEDYAETVEYQLNNFNKILGPLLTLGLAFIGSFVIIAILYPLAKLTTVFINGSGI